VVTIVVSCFTSVEFLVIFVVEEMPVICAVVFCCVYVVHLDYMLIMVTEMLVGRRAVLLRIVKATKSFDKNKDNLVVNGKIK